MKFTKGNNIGGRPKGSRNKLCNRFIEDLATDWVQHGAKAIQVMRVEDPASYVRVVAGLMPKELDAHIDTKFTNFKDWLSWMTRDPKTLEAMTPKVLVAAPDPVIAPMKPL